MTETPRPTAESPALNKAARALSKMRLAEGYRYDWFLNSILEVQAEAAALSDSSSMTQAYRERLIVERDAHWLKVIATIAEKGGYIDLTAALQALDTPEGSEPR